MSVFSRKETKVFQNEGSLSSFVLGVVRDSISKNLLIATDMIWSFIPIKKKSRILLVELWGFHLVFRKNVTVSFINARTSYFLRSPLLMSVCTVLQSAY